MIAKQTRSTNRIWLRPLNRRVVGGTNVNPPCRRTIMKTSEAILFLIAVMGISHSTLGQSVNFGAGASYPAGVTPYVLVSGDFNGDGKIDLAVTDTNTN